MSQSQRRGKANPRALASDNNAPAPSLSLAMLLWEEPRTGEGIRYPLGSHQQRPNFQKSLFYKMFLGCENLTCVSSKKFSVHSKDTLAACAVKVEASLRCSWFRTNILSKKPTIKIFSSTRIYSLTTLPGIH